MPGDCLCSVRVISSDHVDFDSSRPAFFHRVRDTGPRRVDEGQQTQEPEPCQCGVATLKEKGGFDWIGCSSSQKVFWDPTCSGSKSYPWGKSDAESCASHSPITLSPWSPSRLWRIHLVCFQVFLSSSHSLNTQLAHNSPIFKRLQIWDSHNFNH